MWMDRFGDNAFLKYVILLKNLLVLMIQIYLLIIIIILILQKNNQQVIFRGEIINLIFFRGIIYFTRKF